MASASSFRSLLLVTSLAVACTHGDEIAEDDAGIAGSAPEGGGGAAVEIGGSTSAWGGADVGGAPPENGGGGAETTATGGGGETAEGGSPPEGGSDAGPNPAFEVEMTFTTANIGRDYSQAATMIAALDNVGDTVGPKTGPKFIGWQEINESDPCGASCEIDAVHARFDDANGWDTRRPKGTRPDGGMETVKVPITSKGADGLDVRAKFASPGWAGVSPTRFVTVVYSAERNLSVLNVHFIAGAWSCKSEVAKRKQYWNQAWQTLKAEVDKEHDKGRNVIVTGDFNRPRAENSCNPAWTPTSLHAGSVVIGGVGIDYVFALPAADYKWVVSKKGDGTPKRGSIGLGIDGHKAHWVTGKFVPK